MDHMLFLLESVSYKQQNWMQCLAAAYTTTTSSISYIYTDVVFTAIMRWAIK